MSVESAFAGVFDRLARATQRERAALFYRMECMWCWDCGAEQDDCLCGAETTTTTLPHMSAASIRPPVRAERWPVTWALQFGRWLRATLRKEGSEG